MYYRLVFLSPKERKSELENVVGLVCVCVYVFRWDPMENALRTSLVFACNAMDRDNKVNDLSCRMNIGGQALDMCMKSQVWGHRSGQREQLKFSVNIIYLFGLVLPHNFWKYMLLSIC